MAPRPVVVTGAGGLVGSAIASHLEASGVPVIGTSHVHPAPAGFSSQRLELGLVDSVRATLERIRPVAVVHCAAVVPAPGRTADDETNARATRAMDQSVMDACAALSCRLIYASSCIVYDPTEPSTKTEGSHVEAATPYARAKLTGESEASALDGSVVMRLSSPVGRSARHASVFDRFVERALSGEPIELWGSGRREQDFIHVGDIAEFARLAISSAVGGVFNVASGRPLTMRELAEAIVAAVRRGSVTSSARADPQENHTARYSVDAARVALGWTPRVHLEAMIAERLRSLGGHA